ncbi:hypothetical protein KJ925_04820 [Patescibacteria group bacterium]|nr:hypothetical protein [Patescibacteria group bacterium]
MSRPSLIFTAIDRLLDADWPLDELHQLERRLEVVRLLQRIVDDQVEQAELVARELAFADLLRNSRGTRASA